MRKDLIIIISIGVLVAIFLVIIGGERYSSLDLEREDEQIKIKEMTKIKLNFTSLFNVYGTEGNFAIKDGKEIWYDPKFELNPENNEIYQELNYDSQENAIVIFPIFTASAYNEPGFYTHYRDECDKNCLTVEIDEEYVLHFITSNNGFQVLKLLGYEIISDIDVDKNPSILEKYDKVILLHNEYVTKKEFDAITNHPKVFYLYPNALYAEVKTDYQNNTITLLRGHNFPEPEITNGFDWKFDNSILEYDIDCKDMEINQIENGWMLNCYPEHIIHKSRVLLKAIKEF